MARSKLIGINTVVFFYISRSPWQLGQNV